MAQYSPDEIANELSLFFRGKLEPQRESGIPDPVATHAQIMELARLVFLLNNPTAFLYLAKLIKNSMLSVLLQEIAIIVDMLIALDDLQEGANNSGSLIGNLGRPALNNAATALLALEAAGSVQNRPELDRFSRIIDKFSNLLRVNVSSTDGDFVLPRGEARSILNENMQRLHGLHAAMLDLGNHIIVLVENFNQVDIPAQVSQTALISLRLKLLEMRDVIEAAENEENISNSRPYLLRALSGKVVVALIEGFNSVNLGAVKLCGDNTGTVAAGVAGVPSTGAGDGPPFTLQAAGDGTAAEILTGPGPWLLDELDSSELRVKIDGGAEVVIDISQIQGPGIHGRNPAPFPDSVITPVWPGIPVGPSDPPPPPKDDYLPKNLVHVTVDDTVYEFTGQEWFPGTPSPNAIWTRVKMQPPIKLGFKHLGAPWFLKELLPVPAGYSGIGVGGIDAHEGAGFGGWNVDTQDQIEDLTEWDDVPDRRYTHLFQPRVVVELSLLTTVTLAHVSDNEYTISAGTFEDWYFGFYVKKGTDRYEIIRVLSPTSAIIDTRTDAAGSAAGAGIEVYGEPNDFTEVEFGPDLLVHTNDVANRQGNPGGVGRGPHNIPDLNVIQIGPAKKTAFIPSGAGASIASLVSALNDVSNVGPITNQAYTHAGYHCVFSEQTGFSDRLTVQNRSRLLPEKLTIGTDFLHAQSVSRVENTGAGVNADFRRWPGPHQIAIIEDSAHKVLGFDNQQSVDADLDPFLSVEELESISKDLIGAAAGSVEIVETDVFAGELVTNPNSNTVTDTSADFTSLGITPNHLLEILEGDAKEVYFIETNPTPDTLGVRIGGRGFIAGEVDLPYRIFTRQLKISSQTTGLGSSVEVTVAPTQVLPPPLTAQFGTAPAVEAVNASGENLDMSGLEAGDTEGTNNLTVTGVSDDGTQATVSGGVSTGLQGSLFCFFGGTENVLQTCIERLNTIFTSRNLLARNNFDKNLDKLDAAISPVITPGSGFQANIGQTRGMLADLLSVLTDQVNVSAFQANVPTASLNIQTVLEAYSATSVAALDRLLDSLNEHRFDRALSLLVTGQISVFFETDYENASFSGALLQATRTVRQDLPQASPLLGRVEQELNSAEAFIDTGIDPDLDFSDAEDGTILE